jgi:putative aldouronate transport system substrate-binding protein
MKKALALILAGIMMALTLTACGSGGGGTAAPDAPTADAPAADTTTNETAAEGAAPAAPGENGPFAPMAERITLTTGLAHGDPEDPESKAGMTPETNVLNDIARDVLNIEFDYLWTVPREQEIERFQLAVAAGTIPDIMILDAQNFSDFSKAGMLMDLTNAFEEFASDTLKEIFAYADNVPLERCTVDGKLLSVPWTLDSYQISNIFFYRHDWIEALGLETPDTIDKMVAAAQAFVDNEIGGPGTTGLGLQQDLLYWGYDARGLFHAYGSYPGSDVAEAWIKKGNELVAGTVQPETKDALLKLREMYAAGLLNREFATYTMDQLVEDMVGGKVGMVYGEWWCYNWPINSSMEADPDADWRAVLIPSVGAPGTASTLVNGNMVHK